LAGNSGELWEEFVEVESGAKNSRPILDAALDACRQSKAVLIIAKLDRLARNVAFISQLMEKPTIFIRLPRASKYSNNAIWAQILAIPSPT
jgi:DNA invertase Pin-like site-specific DNA recombinase